MTKKIAIVYDWLDKWGGVERMLLELHELFPDAVFYTSYVDTKAAPWTKGLDIRTSFIQKLPPFIKKSRIISTFLYPYAFESFNLSSYDVVISVSSSFAKSVITKPETLHLNIMLTPTRYLWGMTSEYTKNPLARYFIEKLRTWDFIAAQRPDKIVAISKVVADRCKKYYRREASVVYPPFSTEYWHNHTLQKMERVSNFFLVVSRLEPYKKIDVVIEAFNVSKDPLIIIGTGSQLEELRAIADKNIRFIEWVSDDELATYYTHAQALIMPQEEDFGYVALEAQALGCPVISYVKGGAAETVAEGKTGLFFTEQTVPSLLDAVERFHTMSYNLKKSIRSEGVKQVNKFSGEQFKKKLNALINN